MKNRFSRVLHTVYDIFPLMNRPLALAAVISVISVLFLYRYNQSSLSLFVLFIILAAALCVYTKSKKLIVVTLLFLAVCASAVNEFYTVTDLEKLDGQVVNATFVAVEDSEISGSSSLVTVRCSGSDSIPVNTKLSLRYYTADYIKCGDCFSADIKIFSLDDDFKFSKLGDSVYVNSRLVRKTAVHGNNKFFTSIGEIRRFFNTTLKNRFSGDISPTLLALNCGNREYLSDEFYYKVRVCGLSHVMVVSGLHISIILGLFFRFIEKYFYNRTLRAAIAISAIFFLCAVFGFTQSVIRAGAMFIFSAISPLFHRRNDVLNSLGGAVLLMMFINPFCIFNVAFLLSVLSTLAVVWIAPFYYGIIADKLCIKSKLGSAVTQILTVSVCAMIFTAPVSMWVFGKTSLVAPMAFLLITFPVTVALVFNTAGLVLSALGSFDYLAVPFFIVSGICAKYINYIINNLGLLDILYIDADLPGFFTVIFLIFALISGMYIYKYFLKLKQRSYILEVKNRGGNI